MMRSLGILVVVLAGCFNTATPSGGKSEDQAAGEEQEVFPLEAGGDVKPAPFDGKRAMKYLEAICAIGPRMSATPGMTQQVKLITKHFEDLGFKVEEQTFKGKQVSRKDAVEMKNLIIRINPEKDRRIILCSHYDTRPIADQEPDPRDWRKTFVSANDGGSGVALMMELAHHMKAMKINVGVDFVLFDGEEYIFDHDRDEYFLGSEHFAKEYKKNKGKVKYGAAVLLDMIGGKEGKFPLEGNSWLKARDLCKQVWGIAKELKEERFMDQVGDSYLDDHLSLQNVGIPAIDIIPPLTGKYSYPHWHRLTDIPSNCSGDALAGVSKVLTVWLQRVK